MEWPRVIAHADLDAFFAAVEERANTKLIGQPLVVGGLPQSRGVVTSANYAARSFGIHSAMPLAHAFRLCPQATFLPVDRVKIDAASREVMAILQNCASKVQQVSVDEAYLDATGVAAADPSAWAKKLRALVYEQARLTISVGVATNRLVAKVASEFGKPDGLVIIPPGSEAAFLAPLPVRSLPGIGPKTESMLLELGIETASDLQRVATLEGIDTGYVNSLRALALGQDDSEVGSSHGEEQKQVSVQSTFQHDLRTEKACKEQLLQLVDDLHTQLTDGALYVRTLTVRARFASFKSISRSRTLLQPTQDVQLLREVADALLQRLREHDRQPIRLLAVAAHIAPASSSEQLRLIDG